jgi:hypothetical protein
LDSLTAVELRNALAQHTGQHLPATIAFDYPTIDALAGWLLDILCKHAETVHSPVLAGDNEPEENGTRDSSTFGSWEPARHSDTYWLDKSLVSETGVAQAIGSDFDEMQPEELIQMFVPSANESGE